MSPGDPARPHETTGGAPRQVVHSPEQVELHLPVTGPTTRILAYAIDLVAIGLLELGLLVCLLVATPALAWLQTFLPASAPKPDAAHPEAFVQIVFVIFAILLLAQLAVEWTYFIVLETITDGRSLGKRVLGLRVVRDGGSPITLRDSIVRNLLRAVDMLPANYVVGLVAMLVSDQGKRLGDLAAGTVVVRLDRPPRAAPLPDEEGGDDSGFRFERDHIAAIGPRERELIRSALRRSDELPLAQAAQALELAAEALRERIGYGEVLPHERLAFLRALWHASRRGRER